MNPNTKSGPQPKQTGKLSRRWLLPGFLAFVACTVGSGHALADVVSPGETHWQCVQQYDELFNIACIPDPAFAASAAAPRAGLIKAALPVPGNERATAGDDTGNPIISNVRTVPLYIQPSDSAMVGELLQMVLCDASEHCKIRYLSK